MLSSPFKSPFRTPARFDSPFSFKSTDSPRTAAATSLCDACEALGKNIDELRKDFVPMEAPTEVDWVGTYVDMFSPDYKSSERLPWDMNTASRRFVDLRKGELQISADLGDGSRWGRRFDCTATSPVLASTDVPSVRVTNFAVNVPADAPVFAEAQAGALTFKVTLGHAFGRKVLKWSTIYAGSGGSFGGFKTPKGECDNFLVWSDDLSRPRASVNPCEALARCLR